eukprot:3830404-Pyramimonas_sp.AAC.1
MHSPWGSEAGRHRHGLASGSHEGPLVGARLTRREVWQGAVCSAVSTNGIAAAGCSCYALRPPSRA